ncbi:MAG: [FeFe] hydrogenase H-cluster radical SAM maturase HydG [Candidatus Auribacterota bacterium]|nr:[FeFe] hydrogenase H-cluster radical SAM maturase HydG [Candidatus Auribacterota bacterium]
MKSSLDYTDDRDTLIINDSKIRQTLESCKDIDPKEIEEILQEALLLKGISIEQTAKLLMIEDEHLLESVYETARKIKDEIYGQRLVLFAPLYISNLCANECLYCAFRATNKHLKRKYLTQDEIAEEVAALIDQGQKRLLVVAGESYPQEGLNYVLNSIKTVYSVNRGSGKNIRRVNVNLAPLEVDEFKRLKDAQIGTYQLFQEVYHYDTYKKMHVGGRKRNYKYRLHAIDRAFQAGIDDVGIGILFGLYDYRYEIIALRQHIAHLEKYFGMGPHTISVPRLEPADESAVASNPPSPVSDRDFKKLIAVLRISVPYTGLILSTRENPKMRGEALSLGISQISAGSRTNPGGYRVDSKDEKGTADQFSLGDTRPLDEVVYDVVKLGYIPSFCTSCYRSGRTGLDFMELAKPGEIRKFCHPNALLTFTEYLVDYASEQTKKAGLQLVKEKMAQIDSERIHKKFQQIIDGERDIYV